MTVARFALLGMVALVPPDGRVVAQPPPPDGPVEVAPPPRPATPPVAVEAIEGGFRVLLNRRTAELLRDTLEQTDEKQLAASLREWAKQQKKDGAGGEADQTSATLELIAVVVSSQLPGFKKALNNNLGPNGVVIRLTGLQAPQVKFRKPRPRLERAVQGLREAMPLLPEDARDVIEALRAVARTTPLFWKVEPRE